MYLYVCGMCLYTSYTQLQTTCTGAPSTERCITKTKEKKKERKNMVAAFFYFWNVLRCSCPCWHHTANPAKTITSKSVLCKRSDTYCRTRPPAGCALPFGVTRCEASLWDSDVNIVLNKGSNVTRWRSDLRLHQHDLFLRFEWIPSPDHRRSS